MCIRDRFQPAGYHISSPDNGFTALEQEAAACVWRQPKYDRICGQLYEHLCRWHCVCTVNLRDERLHHGTGICENRDVFCPVSYTHLDVYKRQLHYHG